MCAVRAAKFIARKQWVVCGADDCFLRVYNYNTMDKVKAFEAHTDYIRYVTTCLPIFTTLLSEIPRCCNTLGGLGHFCDTPVLGFHADNMGLLQTNQSQCRAAHKLHS